MSYPSCWQDNIRLGSHPSPLHPSGHPHWRHWLGGLGWTEGKDTAGAGVEYQASCRQTATTYTIADNLIGSIACVGYRGWTAGKGRTRRGNRNRSVQMFYLIHIILGYSFIILYFKLL